MFDADATERDRGFRLLSLLCFSSPKVPCPFRGRRARWTSPGSNGCGGWARPTTRKSIWAAPGTSPVRRSRTTARVPRLYLVKPAGTRTSITVRIVRRNTRRINFGGKKTRKTHRSFDEIVWRHDVRSRVTFPGLCYGPLVAFNLPLVAAALKRISLVAAIWLFTFTSIFVEIWRLLTHAKHLRGSGGGK